MFTLKGDTAVNLFYRDMPRLTVDIDLNSQAPLSVAEAWVAFERRLPRKSRTALRSAGGSSSPPSLRRKLFIDAQASISVPSTEKCSSDSSRRTRAPAAPPQGSALPRRPAVGLRPFRQALDSRPDLVHLVPEIIGR